VIGPILFALAGMQTSAVADQCELHVWPTRNYNAVFHGATPIYGGIQLYQSPMEQAKAAIGRILPSEAQAEIISAQVPSATSPIYRYKIVVHEAPEKSRFANWLDKHVGDGPRATSSTSPCYAELHIVFLTIYKTALYKEFQTGFVYRAFGAETNAVKIVRDGTKTRPGSMKTSDAQQTVVAEAELKESFERAISKIFENRKLALTR